MLRDQAVDVNWFLLPNAVGSILGLEVGLRVPVAVVQDHSVCGLQIDSKPTSARRQEEHELLRAWAVERVNEILSLFICGLAIDAAVWVPSRHKKVVENVEHPSHLREDENTVALGAELHQEPVQQDEFATVRHKVLPVRIQGSVLHTLEEVRVVTALAKLHDNVQDRRPISAAALSVLAEKHVTVPGQQVLVHVLLHLGHANVEDRLSLGGQVLLHIGFESPEHEGPQQLVELPNHAGFGLAVIDVQVKPVVKLFGIREHVRQKKVE
mmetsp:Transcript_14388/g.42483  ORF Transcript_14388/g.42483 Transcript_14388/m.42483 type:complete len:268 (-) Transcript_14388:898-1701(-)